MNNEGIIERLQSIETLLERIVSSPVKPYLKTKEACNFLSVSPSFPKNQIY